MVIPAVRDIAIIILAVESLVIGGLLAALLFQLWRLVRLLEEEIKPLLDSANETVNTMRGTTSFVSENVVSPVVRAHSLVAGLNSGIKTWAKPRRPRQRQTRPSGRGSEDGQTHSEAGGP